MAVRTLLEPPNHHERGLRDRKKTEHQPDLLQTRSVRREEKESSVTDDSRGGAQRHAGAENRGRLFRFGRERSAHRIFDPERRNRSEDCRHREGSLDKAEILRTNKPRDAER